MNQNSKVSVKQMEDYLRIATQMESDLYAAQILVSKIENKIKQYSSVNYYTESNYINDSINDQIYIANKKKTPKAVKVFFIWAIISSVLFIIGVSISLFKNHGASSKNLLGILYFILLLFGSVFAFAIVIAVILKTIRSKAEKNVAQNKIINKINLNNSNQLLIKNKKILDNYNLQLEGAKKLLLNSQNNIMNLYNENILPNKYRNFVAVATMYQWLKDGVCTEIYGHGGVFDTYETHLRYKQIIGELQEIRYSIDAVMANQELLYNEVVRGNEIADKTYKSVLSIEKNTDTILKNSNQIKLNTDIIAMNSINQTRMQEYSYYKSLYY